MPDFEKMYFKLFAAMADAHEILEKAMNETEELYINSDEKKTLVKFELLKNDNDK